MEWLFIFASSRARGRKCERFSDDIMLSLFNVEQDSDFRPTRPKIILYWPQACLSVWRQDGRRRWAPCLWFLRG
ncbi:hypothetical protein CO670_09685 [Rhizobium sp. J15]|nr:hypothetical protein CO670_09685 [Rhizobium sp. J15]